MHSRLKSFERRLARITAWLGQQTEAAERERDLCEARKKIAALIREGLERAGLDPAEAVRLRRYEAFEPPQPRNPLRRAEPGESFFVKLEALAERMRGHPPSLATASPAALLAYYCFGDGAREAPA